MHRILDYPYPWPRASFTFSQGTVLPFSLEDRQGRHPILATGSNRSPNQLLRKFGKHAVIPVEKVWCRGLDVVYGARVSGYGAVPATLQPCPGVRVEVALNWLTPIQMDQMDRSEGLGRGYEKVLLSSNIIDLDEGLSQEHVPAYITEAGALTRDGACLALSEVKAEGRTFESISSGDVLGFVRGLFCPGIAMAAFVEALSNDAAFRAQMRTKLFEIGCAAQADWVRVKP